MTRSLHPLLTVFAGLLALTTLSSATPAAAKDPTPVDPRTVPFIDRTTTVGDTTIKTQVFVPVHWNKRKHYPVILFLHGSGERGDDGKAQTKNGIRKLIAQDMDGFPCVVVCPQSPGDKTWTEPVTEALALKALDDAVAEFNGDTRREYLTGLSLGGYGTYDIAANSPGRFAAIAPCCGGAVYPWNHKPAAAPPVPTTTPPAVPAAVTTPPPAGTTGDPGVIPIPPAPPVDKDPYRTLALKIVGIPIWTFHGDIDNTIPVSEDRQMVGVLFALKADVTYSEYHGVGHNSWDNAYAEPKLLDWFLSHKLPK